jgi:hypothetical protein
MLLPPLPTAVLAMLTLILVSDVTVLSDRGTYVGASGTLALVINPTSLRPSL